MNDNRLSTNKNLSSSELTIIDIDTKVKELLSQPSNFEVHSDGRIYIKSEQTYWKGRGNVELEVFNKDGLLLYSFQNLEKAANFFNLNKHIIKYRLNSGKPLLLKLEKTEKEVYFKRAKNN